MLAKLKDSITQTEPCKELFIKLYVYSTQLTVYCGTKKGGYMEQKKDALKTFRLDKKLLKTFLKLARKKKQTQRSIIEKFMTEFIKEN